jgi:hypothetical protein
MTFSSRTVGIAKIACVVAAAIALTACGGSSHKKSTPSTPDTTPVTTSPTVTPSPTPVVKAVNPLTGGAPSSHGVVAVKIDDTGNGRPQVNIDQADVVYIEEVEGGLTRLLAVYDSSLPTVEAVRSTRAADPEILAQYGPIAYVASGGASNPLQVLDKSPLKTSINDRGGPGFARDGNRGAPYNLRANLATIAKAKKAPKAKSVGFTWSASTAQLAGTPAATSLKTVVGGTPVNFVYDTKTHQYRRYIGGSPQSTASGKPIETPNVIVQFCSVTTYAADTDVNGNPNKYTHTVGKGKAVVYRNGHKVTGSWSRASAKAGTSFTSGGKPIALAPGGLWVVLVATNAALH